LEANDIAKLSYTSKPNASLLTLKYFAKTFVLRCNSQLPWNHLLGEFGKDQQAVYLSGNS
jgi:hypothetical protein